MKRLTENAADAARTRESFNKDLCPIIPIDKLSLDALGIAYELYPMDKSKFLQAIITDEKGAPVSVLSFRIVYTSKDVKSKVLQSLPLTKASKEEVNNSYLVDDVDDSLQDEEEKGDDE